MNLGIDVSNNNGAISVAALKRAHPELVVLGVKATEGLTFRDAYAGANFRAAAAAGLVVNLYHFGRPSANPGTSGGVAEANAFWAAVSAYRKSPAFGRLVLDYEDAHDPAYAVAFVARIRALSGVEPMVYVSGSRTGEVASTGCPLWIAAYGPSVTEYVPKGSRLFLWQYTDRLDGHLDASHVYVSRSALLGRSSYTVLDVIRGGKTVATIRYGGGRVRHYLTKTLPYAIARGPLTLRRRKVTK